MGKSLNARLEDLKLCSELEEEAQYGGLTAKNDAYYRTVEAYNNLHSYAEGIEPFVELLINIICEEEKQTEQQKEFLKLTASEFGIFVG